MYVTFRCQWAKVIYMLHIIFITSNPISLNSTLNFPSSHVTHLDFSGHGFTECKM